MRRLTMFALLAVLVAVPLAAGDTLPEPAPPPPELGESFKLERVSGTVRYKSPNPEARWIEGGRNTLPFGYTVDATSGVARISTATGFTDVPFQSGTFRSGQFVVRQAKKAGALTDLRLAGGNFGRCTGGEARASARRVSIRKLFGKGKGRFRTTGRFSAATVRGTEWLTDDSCVGTLTAVSSGVVDVRDFITKRTTRVRRGHSYRATRGPDAGLD